MGHHAMDVPVHWKVFRTLECENKQQLFLEFVKYQGHYVEWDTKQYLFLYTGKNQGHQNGHQAIVVDKHWKVLGTLELDIKQKLFLHTEKYQG